MKIVKQSSSVISGLKPLEHIEKIGRICYKSEDKIMEGTANKFVKMLFGNKHHAMLEHYRFIMMVTLDTYICLHEMKLDHMEFSSYDGRLIISFNARTLIDLENYIDHNGKTSLMSIKYRKLLIDYIVDQYKCNELFGLDDDYHPDFAESCKHIFALIPNSYNCMSHDEYRIHGWKSIHFITDRGISHEIVRHREETSFAQESTRYCNYSAEKFGQEITVIEQGFEGEDRYLWRRAIEECEVSYFALLDRGIKPQMARSILPTCLKTEIIVTAPMYEWEHIVNIRYYGKAGVPHPLMVELMESVSKEVFGYNEEN